MKILIVDDEPAIRLLVKKYANFEGYETDEAADGMEAVIKCRQSAYDIVIMDVMMPVMGGLEAAKNIRKMDRPDAKTVAIIAMSANAFHDDVEQSLAAGMNVHMAKPLDFDKLLATIKEYCDKN